MRNYYVLIVLLQQEMVPPKCSEIIFMAFGNAKLNRMEPNPVCQKISADLFVTKFLPQWSNPVDTIVYVWWVARQLTLFRACGKATRVYSLHSWLSNVIWGLFPQWRAFSIKKLWNSSQSMCVTRTGAPKWQLNSCYCITTTPIMRIFYAHNSVNTYVLLL